MTAAGLRPHAILDLPTISETGIPGYEATTWSGVIVPAGAPKTIVARLNAEINRALVAQTTKEILAGRNWLAAHRSNSTRS